MKLMGCKLGAFPPKTLYETWVLDDSYTKMTAAIDMFLNKFPTHEMSKMRYVLYVLDSRIVQLFCLLGIYALW